MEQEISPSGHTEFSPFSSNASLVADVDEDWSAKW